MFTIDLLNGQYVPIRSTPRGLAVAAVAFVVPSILGIFMVGSYLQNRVLISVHKQSIAGYEERIDRLSEGVKQQKSIEEEKTAIGNCMNEVFSCLVGHNQWSPILVALAENMPSTVLLADLDGRQELVKREEPNKDDTSKVTEVTLPVRSLHMSVVCSGEGDCDKEVQDFKDRLGKSDVLRPRLEDIRVSHKFGGNEVQDYVSYDIDCYFKPGL